MIPTNPLGRGLLRIRFLMSPLADGSIWLMGRKAGVTLKWVFGHCYGGRDNSKKPVCCDSIADTNRLRFGEWMDHEECPLPSDGSRHFISVSCNTLWKRSVEGCIERNKKSLMPHCVTSSAAAVFMVVARTL